MSALLTMVLLAGEASASQTALDPQTRLHVGFSVVPSPGGVGLTAGFDSRLTRILAIDVGAFASPMRLPDGIAPTAGTRPDFVLLRHGIHVMPGFRIPHQQPRTWAWEVFLRGGAGVAWAADLSPEAAITGDTTYAVDPKISGIGGGDLLVRFGAVGLRASGKAWMFEVLDPSPLKAYVAVRSQFGVEFLFQW